MSEIKKYLPSYYQKSSYVQAVTKPIDNEFDRLYEKNQRTFDNLSPDCADEDGISDFERDFGIKNAGATLDVRKRRVKEKMTRPQTSTPQKIAQLALSYDDTAVFEEDFANYRLVFSLSLSSVIPELLEALEEIKPAHLAVSAYASDREAIQGKAYFGGVVTGIRDNVTVCTPVNTDDIYVKSKLYTGFATVDKENGRAIRG